MRLICPNCSAQYEIPDDVMPAEGRDVQCSNCGTTWFQDHPDAVAEHEAASAPDPVQEVFEDPAPVEPQEVAEPEPEAEPLADVPDPEPESPVKEETDESSSSGRRQLDPDITDVLREEAERETAARQSEADALESQPELGLTDAGADTDKKVQSAVARTMSYQSDGQDAEATALGSRKDLLPDIEEINSTLRSNSNRSPDEDPGQTAQIEVQEKRSSRRGFVLTVALVAVMALIYAYAPQIAAAVPSAEPALAAYVNMIDGWRIWMDDQLSSLLTWLDAAAVSSAQ